MPAPLSLLDYRTLSSRIILIGSANISHLDFLREVVKLLAEFTGCDDVRLMLKDGESVIVCGGLRRSADGSQGSPDILCRRCNGGNNAGAWESDEPGRLMREQLGGRRAFMSPKAQPRVTLYDDVAADKTEPAAGSISIQSLPRRLRELDYTALILVPLESAGERMGILMLGARQAGRLAITDLPALEEIAQTIGSTIVTQRAQWALRERVKELTCLYGIAKLVEQPGISRDEILQGVVELIPPGWQYPEITAARITHDNNSFTTANFRVSPSAQSAEIVVNGVLRGQVAAVYLEEKPELDEGPFLREERNLINAIAGQVGLIIERKEVEEERARLQEQLRHADRLATIGQLAAGVAHELNEPLGGILGFAQLARKAPNLPRQAEQDMDKIVAATLYAREIVKKLLLFARQMPPRKAPTNLNQVVNEVMTFFEGRCSKQGVELAQELAPDLPEITADRAQLSQVLVNLVVNALQAMPEGGKLTIRTVASDGNVTLTVRDTGVGMSAEVRSRIFVPFFTTKDINQGTGIGLAVVHGIVASHGGTITFESEVNRGATFIVTLPITSPEESN